MFLKNIISRLHTTPNFQRKIKIAIFRPKDEIQKNEPIVCGEGLKLTDHERKCTSGIQKVELLFFYALNEFYPNVKHVLDNYIHIEITSVGQG